MTGLRTAHWTERWPPEVLLLLALSVVALAAAPLNTDTAYCLVAGRRLLGGARLYVDLLETNPPLIFWLFAAVASAGRWLSLSDAQMVGSFVALLLTVSTLTTLAVLALEPASDRLHRAILLAAFFAAAIVPYFAWTGQREQIAAILALPYCLVAARAARGQNVPAMLSIWCGVLAGAGFAIKPFFLLTWAAVECGVIAAQGWRRAWRADSLTIGIVQIVYALSILVFTPLYVTRMIPMAAALYSGYGNQIGAGVRSERFIVLVIVALTGAAALFRKRPVAGGLVNVGIFGAATLGWLFAYVAQRKGWAYHLIPAFVYGAVCAATGAREWIRTALASTSRGARRIAFALALPSIAALALAAPAIPDVLRAMSQGLDGPREIETAMADMVGRLADRQPVYFLSTSMWPGFPVVNMTHTEWPYRYHFMWPIPALYPGRRQVEPAYRAPAEQSPLERQFFDAVIDDLTRVPPKLLVVDNRPRLAAMNGRRFDFVRYFSASDRFRTLFAGYQSIGTVGPWEVYERR